MNRALRPEWHLGRFTAYSCEQHILMALLLLISVAFATTQLRVLDAPPISKDPGLHVRFLNLTTPRQAIIPAILTTVDSPATYARVFAANADPSECRERVKPSTTADVAGCQYAVNAGTFNMDTGACVGDVISEGREISFDETSGFASWGMSASQHVFGEISRENVTSLQLSVVVSGFIGPLLVDGGVPVLSGSSLVAPRTAVGADEDGRLLLLTVDGVEDAALGMNISELAQAFVGLGALHALNLDGGGSTSAWWKGHGDAHGVIDTPTCNDGPIVCERAVASVLCIMPGR